jgi:hypothetical protein
LRDRRADAAVKERRADGRPGIILAQIQAKVKE